MTTKQADATTQAVLNCIMAKLIEKRNASSMTAYGQGFTAGMDEAYKIVREYIR